MTQWLPILTEAIASELNQRPLIAALATVDSAGHPHVRHVVCRRIDADGAIRIASDARTAKNQHIHTNPSVELALWLPQRRQQFRIAGTISIDPQREETWREMSDATRATFFWPSPAQPLTPAQSFPAAVPATAAPSTNFEVLLLTPHQVEHLEISPHPHRRRRWRRSTNWSLEDLTP
ncbi:MAG TPA: pyridoxamine 5'-phosphate oxidase family protein [Tepidisphaeraceae bacterium]|jgi:pyridoxamine 5'-phosphate oxidase|nr:pyridoxamine 5'-phosphate oxidase family protein [Tepidisphaeraceae bacterium]